MTPPETAPEPRPPSGKAQPLPAPASAWRRSLGRAVAWLAGLMAAGVVAVLCVVALALALAYPNLPDIQSLTDYRPKLPLRVYASDGVLFGEFGEGHGVWLVVTRGGRAGGRLSCPCVNLRRNSVNTGDFAPAPDDRQEIVPRRATKNFLRD